MRIDVVRSARGQLLTNYFSQNCKHRSLYRRNLMNNVILISAGEPYQVRSIEHDRPSLLILALVRWRVGTDGPFFGGA